MEEGKWAMENGFVSSSDFFAVSFRKNCIENFPPITTRSDNYCIPYNFSFLSSLLMASAIRLMRVSSFFAE